MALFDLSLIETTIIEPMAGRRLSKPTRVKWRRLAGIPAYRRYCDGDTAARLVAVACIRRQSPVQPISLADSLRFVVQNQDEIMAAISGCQVPVVLKLDGAIGVDECIAVLAEQTGQRVSNSTLRRWCGELGIAFYSGVEIGALDVDRLLDHCKRLQQERVDRGRRMGLSRRDLSSNFKYCEAS